MVGTGFPTIMEHHEPAAWRPKCDRPVIAQNRPRKSKRNALVVHLETLAVNNRPQINALSARIAPAFFVRKEQMPKVTSRGDDQWLATFCMAFLPLGWIGHSIDKMFSVTNIKISDRFRRGRQVFDRVIIEIGQNEALSLSLPALQKRYSAGVRQPTPVIDS